MKIFKHICKVPIKTDGSQWAVSRLLPTVSEMKP
jgi:hypothetical protein